MRTTPRHAEGSVLANGPIVVPGLGEVRVTTAVREELVLPLLRELRQERCEHSWHAALRGCRPSELMMAFRTLLRDERKGTLFAYYRETPSGVQGIGMAAIGDRVCDTYPISGYPVLGRAFVRRSFRNRGLHLHMMKHRMEHCQRKWGGLLMGVHIGTSQPVVERHLRSVHPGRVVFLGMEALPGGGKVRALLAITKALRHALTQGPHCATDEGRTLRRFVEDPSERRALVSLRDSLAWLASRDSRCEAVHRLCEYLRLED